MAKPSELLIQRGSTFEFEVFWAHESKLVYKPITAISLAFGPPRLTVSGHGIPDGWPVAVTRVLGMKQINAENSPPSGKDYRTATVIDANTVEFNDMDATGFSAYTSGGFIQFKQPVDFAGYTPRMDIKDRVGGTILASSDIDTAPLNIITLTPDEANSKIKIMIGEPDTKGITWNKGVTDLEMVSPLGVVTKLKMTSTGDAESPDPVRVVGEVTTST